MVTIRRLYIFLVCAISLQAVTWAVITLLQNLLPPGPQGSVTATAFQSAVIIVGLPFFLVHWLWAQRLARQDEEERGTALRRLYLYFMLATFLFPFVGKAHNLVFTLLRLAFGSPSLGLYPHVSQIETIVNTLVAMAVLAVLWLYHQRIVASDARALPETGNSAIVRRLYILLFSAFGLIMASAATILLLRWIMGQFGDKAITGGMVGSDVASQIAALAVGLPLWLIFWGQAQRLFSGPDEEERQSTLRKVYLYLAVFVSMLSAVASATWIFAWFLRGLLGLPSMGDLRDPLSIIIVMVVLWAYHSLILRGDAALAGEAPRQAGVRRLYLYLVAAIGLASFLGGLGGNISVLIRWLANESFGPGLKEQLAWSVAALIAGLPVWILPWRRLQTTAVATGTAGAEERQSVVRKIYLYFYLFIATMTALASAVYIVFRLLRLVLGDLSSVNLISDLGHAIAFGLIAVGVWLYHGFALRSDGKIAQQEKSQRLAVIHVAVVDAGEGRLGCAILSALQRELPGLSLHPIGLTPSAATAMGTSADHNAVLTQLSQAGLIVGPWFITMTGGAGGQVSPEVGQTVIASPARKLLVPGWLAGWEWAGVDRWNVEDLARQTAHAVKQIIQGEEVKPSRPLGVGAIIAIIILALFVLPQFVGLLIMLLSAVGGLGD